MKTTKFIFLTIVFTRISLLSQTWAPYYSFSLTEGVYIPSSGRWGVTTILCSDIGTIVKPLENHSGMLLYELKYTGPGLKRQEGEKFEQRNMAHIFVVQHNFNLSSVVSLKTKYSYTIDLWRSGTNELWGLGLYDSFRWGLSEEVELKFGNLVILPQLAYSFIHFPNYTSLLEELKAGAEETTAGKQDNSMVQTNIKVKIGKQHTAGVSFNIQNYDKQQVLTESGTYGSEKQRDFSLEVYYHYSGIQAIKFIYIEPYISYKLKDSNQGYLHFKTFASTPTFYADFYDYTRLSISLPMSFYITKNKKITYRPEFERTLYTSRLPRDEENNFVDGEKQVNNLFLHTIAYTSQSEDEVRKVTLFYTFQQQSSNTKFEKYFPYNYTGHYFGLQFNYSY